MKTLILLLVMFWWLLSAACVDAQDKPNVLNLHQAIEMAMRHNIAILQGKAGIIADSQQVLLEKAGNYPQVRFNTSFSRSSTPTQFPLFFQNQTVLAEVGTRNSFNAQVEATQKLFDFGQSAHRIRAAKLGMEANRESYSDHVRQIRNMVKLYFYSVLYYQKMDSIYGTILPLSDELRTTGEAQLRNGISIPVDVLQTEANTEQIRVQMTGIRSKLQQSKNHLAGLLGTDESDIRLTGTVPSVNPEANPVLNYDSLYALALENSGDLRRLEMMKRRQRELAEASKSVRKPTISLFGSAAYYGPRIDALYPEIQGLKTYNLKAGITITYNIFDGHASSLRTRQLQTEVRQADLEKKNGALNLSMQIRDLLSDLNSLLALKKSNQLSLRLMETNARVAHMNYENGAAPRMTYIQAMIPAAIASVTLEQTEFNILQTVLSLQMEVGNENLLISD